MKPLVSVICVCYNHEPFVLEALESVKAQTYSHVEMIIVDDGSVDKSASLIGQWIGALPGVQFLNLKTNHGYCVAFNKALALAKGEFVIDFATDDIMLPEKIERQVNLFAKLDERFGVVFSDAIYIDTQGKYLRDHFDYLFRKRLVNKIPQGEVYSDVLSRYFIPSPTMMVRAKVFQAIGGYDENLAYEDFDFWVRSARHFHYAFLNLKLMKIRRHSKSMSTGWYKKGDPQLLSTYKVCLKALAMNQSLGETQALAKRAKYELRQSVFSENQDETELFYRLLKEINQARIFDVFLYKTSRLGLPLSVLRKWYHRIKFGPLYS